MPVDLPLSTLFHFPFLSFLLFSFNKNDALLQNSCTMIIIYAIPMQPNNFHHINHTDEQHPIGFLFLGSVINFEP